MLPKKLLPIFASTFPMRHHKVCAKIFTPPPPKFVLLTTQKFLWFLSPVMIVGLLIWLGFSGTFNIKHILCLYEDRPCSDAIESELNNFLGKNILTFQAATLEKKLAAADISVRAVSVTPQLPDTLRINLGKRSGIMTLGIATESAKLLVDESQTPFEIEEKSLTPAQIISSRVKNLSLGEPIKDKLLLSAISLHQALQDNFVAYKLITADENLLSVDLIDGQIALFNPAGDMEKTAASLQLILREATIQPKPREIDLRFDKPVLRF